MAPACKSDPEPVRPPKVLPNYERNLECAANQAERAQELAVARQSGQANSVHPAPVRVQFALHRARRALFRYCAQGPESDDAK